MPLTGHGIGTWDWNMGWGGTALGEIPRYYQISLLSSENHRVFVGGRGEIWNLIGNPQKKSCI